MSGCSSEDVEKLEQENDNLEENNKAMKQERDYFKIATHRLEKELDSSEKKIIRLERLNAEMLEVLKDLNEYYKHHNGDYTAETKADVLIKKAEGME